VGDRVLSYDDSYVIEAL